MSLKPPSVCRFLLVLIRAVSEGRPVCVCLCVLVVWSDLGEGGSGVKNHFESRGLKKKKKKFLTIRKHKKRLVPTVNSDR